MLTRGGRTRAHCKQHSGNLFDTAFENQLPPRRRGLGAESFWGVTTRKLPSTLEEKQLNVEVLKTFDKAFSCAWINERTVAFGTKNDKVAFVDAESLQPLQTVHLPVSSERPPDASDYDIPVTCGIRSLERNACGDLLAAGGCGPNDCAILGLPSRRLLLRLQGHKDWVFGVTWVTDRLLVTGSRDRSIKLWDVDVEPGAPPVCTTPLASKQLKRGKARDVKWCEGRDEIAALGTDGTVSLWDVNMQRKSQVKLAPSHDELVCMATDGERLYATGSLDCVCILDPRAARAAGQLAKPVTSLAQQNGNRSLQFQHGLLSIGNGCGEVWLYDLRAGDYLHMPRESGVSAERQCLHLGKGWLERNETYREYFEDITVYNAAYAHEWDPGGTRMFICGGPLATGLQGSYVSMWR